MIHNTFDSFLIKTHEEVYFCKNWFITQIWQVSFNSHLEALRVPLNPGIHKERDSTNQDLMEDLVQQAIVFFFEEERQLLLHLLQNHSFQPMVFDQFDADFFLGNCSPIHPRMKSRHINWSFCWIFSVQNHNFLNASLFLSVFRMYLKNRVLLFLRVRERQNETNTPSKCVLFGQSTGNKQ